MLICGEQEPISIIPNPSEMRTKRRQGKIEITRYNVPMFWDRVIDSWTIGSTRWGRDEGE